MEGREGGSKRDEQCQEERSSKYHLKPSSSFGLLLINYSILFVSSTNLFLLFTSNETNWFKQIHESVWGFITGTQLQSFDSGYIKVSKKVNQETFDQLIIYIWL